MKDKNLQNPRYVRVNAGIATHTSAMHTELHQRLYALVSEPDKVKLHLTEELLKSWRALIDQELDLNHAQRASEVTAQLQQLDEERDGLLTQLFSAIRSNAHSPIKALREPGEKLLPLVGSYKGIQSEQLEAESAHVDGLLMDLAKLPTQTAALGLTVIIDALKTNSTQFGELSKQRVVSQSKRTVSSMKQVRPMTDEAFYEVRSNIEAAYIFATDDADRKLIAALVKAINLLIESYSTNRKSSKAQLGIAKQIELENNHKLIDPLLPKFAASPGYGSDDLSFTGRTTTANKETRYEVLASSTGKKQWARLVGGELMLVKTRTSGKGNGSAKVKPKKNEKPTDENTAPKEEPKSKDEGHGSATVTPKS